MVIASALLICAYADNIYRIDKNSNLSSDIAEITYDELKEDKYYKVDSLLVVDECANYTHNNEITAEYVTVCFYTQDDELSFAMLEVKNTSPLFSYISDYIYDENQVIGDCYVSGYFLFNRINDYGLKKYYNNSIEYFKSIFDMDYNKTNYELTYISDNFELSFKQALKNDCLSILFIAIALFVVAMIIVIIMLITVMELEKKGVANRKQFSRYVYGNNMTDDNELKCEYCGNKLEKDSLFCKYCGKQVNTTNAFYETNPTRNNKFDDISITRRELFKRYMPENTVKSYLMLMILRYIICGINFIIIIMNPYYVIGIIDIVIMVGITLGMQLKINKTFAIISVIYSIITMGLWIYLFHSPTGVIIFTLSFFPLLYTIDFDKILAKKLK